MLSLSTDEQLREVLCMGAHCDDVEIGCGGTLATLARARPDLRITVVVFTSDLVREAESRAALARLLPNHRPRLEFCTFRNGYFPAEWAAIKERIESLRTTVQPDLILTHNEHDKHQDHRVLAELTWNAFRDHLILQYEIPKYDGDLGRPQLYVPLELEVVELKERVLIDSFVTQAEKRWFTADTFHGLMRLRGIEAAAPDGFAEAFYARKLVLGM
ncbi:MAG TPA: PIG-L family deacetylase [Steroidobacteraceae bacterium]|nr:PIG-L family deacetylase [Steroidobacteraceae bacterium]HRX88740.1 PIG-L family deacetylase [Steroidobacteraceae bacterium]